jgi:hypothetical protein
LVFKLVRVAKVTPIASWSSVAHRVTLSLSLSIAMIGAVMVEANSGETPSVSLGAPSLNGDLKAGGS